MTLNLCSRLGKAKLAMRLWKDVLKPNDIVNSDIARLLHASYKAPFPTNESPTLAESDDGMEQCLSNEAFFGLLTLFRDKDCEHFELASLY